ncbi:MAG: hypothetical protein DCF23_04505 [Cyanobium sp.]|nr:MAG: hypothetical protein DCF23_04505 [Cyanobium sp.]
MVAACVWEPGVKAPQGGRMTWTIGLAGRLAQDFLIMSRIQGFWFLAAARGAICFDPIMMP